MESSSFWLVGAADNKKKSLSQYLREEACAHFLLQEEVCRLLRASEKAFKENCAGLNFLP